MKDTWNSESQVLSSKDPKAFAGTVLNEELEAGNNCWFLCSSMMAPSSSVLQLGLGSLKSQFASGPGLPGAQ